MRYKCAFSGSGGQGAALMAKLVCLAGIKEGKQVVMTQTYGIEQRGGDSTGFVIVSDQKVGNPIVESDADIAVTMSESMYEAALDNLKPCGILFVNSSLVTSHKSRFGIQEVRLPVSDMAQEAGNVRVANIIMLGAVLAKTGMLAPASVTAALEETMGKKKAALLQGNVAALTCGVEAIQKETGK